MAILEIEQREGTKGITKQLSPAAMGIIFDTLQRDQYSEPEKSAIRELVSNGLDATREKMEAIQILQGKAKPSDFYVHREDEVLADSNWFPGYYDLAYLTPGIEDVQITYYKRADQARDLITIEDWGVGIGNVKNPISNISRLEGVLKLGYSTKRNSHTALGKFGMGAKAGLSTGVSYYVMTTRHNGLEYEFELYDYKVHSTIPRFENGVENIEFTLEAGTEFEYKGWCRRTDMCNGTTISLEVKKHHFQTYVNAVKSQLLYFPNVAMTVIDESEGTTHFIDIQAKIEYEDDTIVMSSNSQYSKPHILLNGINYGYVNYQELELQEISGSIGFKIDPSDVTVHPSRERLIWDDKTRAATLLMQHKVEQIANKLISKELEDTDIIKWVLKAATIRNKGTTSSGIVAKLVGIAGMSSFNLVYSPLNARMDKIEDFFYGWDVTAVIKNSEIDRSGKRKTTLSRQKINSWADLLQWSDLSTTSITQFCIQEGNTRPAVEISLLKSVNVLIKFSKQSDNADSYDFTTKEVNATVLGRGFAEFVSKQDKIGKLLKESSKVINLDKEVVAKEVEEELAKEEEEEKLVKMTAAQRRKHEGSIILRELKANLYLPEERKAVYKNALYIPSEMSKLKAFIQKTHTVKLSDIAESETEYIWAYVAEEELMHAIMLRLYYHPNIYAKDNIVFVLVAKDNGKYMTDHTHISKFILNISKEHKSISMDKRLVNYHTARKLSTALKEVRFLANYSIFDSKLADTYRKLHEFAGKYYEYSTTTPNYQDIFGTREDTAKGLDEFADKVISLQLYIAEHSNEPEAIAQMARHIFSIPQGEETFEVAVGIDLELWQQMEELLIYAEPVKNLFNHLAPLLTVSTAIPDDLETEIRSIIQQRIK